MDRPNDTSMPNNNNNSSAPSGLLPPGWESVFDNNTGRWYYANRNTGRSSWEPPSLPPPPPPPPPMPPILQSNNNTNNTASTGINHTQTTSLRDNNNNSNGSSSTLHNNSVTTDAVASVTTSLTINSTQSNGARQQRQISAEEVSRLTQERFPTPYTRANKKQIKDEVDEFARTCCFAVRLEGERDLVCTKADSSYEKALKSGRRELKTTRKRSSQACSCPYLIHLSTKGEGVTIDRMNTMHNHPCTASNLIEAVRKSGTAVSVAVQSCTNSIAPIILSRQPYACNLIRAIIRRQLHPSIAISADLVKSVIKGVQRQIELGNYVPPPVIDMKVLQEFTTPDHASSNVDSILQDLCVGNSDPEKTWIVTSLMNKLKNEDPYFDFRLHYDEHQQVDAVVWQTGPMRAALRLYGQTACFDTRNSDNMNTLRMRYMSFILQDANNQIVPASEAFVFEEEMELYLFVINSTFDMAPLADRSSLLCGSADYFLDPVTLKMVAPNIVLLVDEYHFLSGKNRTNILLKDFGPTTFNLIKGPFKKAFDAGTKEECFKHIDEAIAAVGQDSLAVEKIVRWQSESDRWGRYMWSGIEGIRNRKSSSPAEANHASLVAIAPDKSDRTLEWNIADVMKRTALLFQKYMHSKAQYEASGAAVINSMSGQRKSHLSEPRIKLDMLPYEQFQEQYDLYMQYNCNDEDRDGILGCYVSHTSQGNSGDRYFIPDGGSCPCRFEKDMKVGGCRHAIAKRIHRKEAPFLLESVHPCCLFLDDVPQDPRAEEVPSHPQPTAIVLSKIEDMEQYRDANSMLNSSAVAEVSVQPLPSLATSAAAEVLNQPQPSTGALTTTAPTLNALAFASPSKVKSFTGVAQPTGLLKSATDITKNVNYHTLLNAAQEVVKAAGSRCNPTQHFILSHLTGLKDLLSSGDYSSERYTGTPLEKIASKLDLLSSSDRVLIVPHMPKTKTGSRQGAPPTVRFGGDKSTASKPPRMCGFCGGQGGVNGMRVHSNKTNCPKKEQYGVEFQVKEATRSDVGFALTEIAEGRDGKFIDVATIGLSSRETISSIPVQTKRLVVKGYHAHQDGPYLFCSCLDKLGDVFNRVEGTRTRSYDNVLIKSVAVLTGIAKLDYVFHLPLTEEDDQRKRPAVELTTTSHTDKRQRT